MHEYGTTKEQMAEVAVATRKWASLNPRAFSRDPLTIDDVLKSRLICWPFNLLDCCLVTDAGGAVVVTSAERARDLPKPPVYVLGTGECVTHQMVSQMPAFDRWDAAEVSGARAFAMSGVKHADVDVAEFYDAFTITPIPRARGARLLPARRGRPIRQQPAHRTGRGLPDEHQRRRALLHPHRHVRHLHHHRGRPSVARRMRPAPGRRRQDRGLPRHRRVWSAAATMIVSTERG
jgi:hypothetical protein